MKITWKSGRESFDCYSTTAGLLVGGFAKQETPMGSIEAISEFKDYKEFAGLKQVMTLTSYEYGPMQPEAFAPPAAVATLITQKPGN